MPDAQICLLDNVRLSNGQECLRNYYTDIVSRDPQKAFELLNDHRLSFSTLYVLRHDLEDLTSSLSLNPLYGSALRLTILLSGSRGNQTEAEIRSGGSNTEMVLNWMLKTGYRDEALGQSYDTLMDNVAALLVKSFKSHLALYETADLIFMRHRSGKEIHDLIWAFFEACSPESLFFIAKRLSSSYSTEVTLAKKLLHFVPTISKDTDSASAYSNTWRWLSENLPFLYYSGESLNLSPLPEYYILSLACKYLCHRVSPKTGHPLKALTYIEQKLSNAFTDLPDHIQVRLADFSYTLFRENTYKWSMWITLPITQQVSIAVPGSGVFK